MESSASLQLPGIPLLPLPVAPRHLPFHAGFSYFELDRNHPTLQSWKKSASSTTTSQWPAAMPRHRP